MKCSRTVVHKDRSDKLSFHRYSVVVCSCRVLWWFGGLCRWKPCSIGVGAWKERIVDRWSPLCCLLWWVSVCLRVCVGGGGSEQLGGWAALMRELLVCNGTHAPSWLARYHPHSILCSLFSTPNKAALVPSEGKWPFHLNIRHFLRKEVVLICAGIWPDFFGELSRFALGEQSWRYLSVWAWRFMTFESECWDKAV